MAARISRFNRVNQWLQFARQWHIIDANQQDAYKLGEKVHLMQVLFTLSIPGGLICESSVNLFRLVFYDNIITLIFACLGCSTSCWTSQANLASRNGLRRSCCCRELSGKRSFTYELWAQLRLKSCGHKSLIFWLRETKYIKWDFVSGCGHARIRLEASIVSFR